MFGRFKRRLRALTTPPLGPLSIAAQRRLRGWFRWRLFCVANDALLTVSPAITSHLMTAQLHYPLISRISSKNVSATVFRNAQRLLSGARVSI
jgi:hypothetical protein